MGGVILSVQMSRSQPNKTARPARITYPLSYGNPACFDQAKRVGAYDRLIAYRLFVVLYVMYLLEGALRKWVLPELSEVLYFIRDPIALALYVWCWTKGLIWRHWIGTLWIGLGIATSLIGLVQYLEKDLSFIAYALAVRSYWLYMPLIIVLPCVFDTGKMASFLRSHALVMIPYAILIAIQYEGEATSYLNIGATPEEGAAIFVGERGRPYGMFQYYVLNVFFVATSFALLIAGRKYNEITLWSVVLGGCSIIAHAVAISLTGSRRIWVLFAAMVAGMVIAALIGRRKMGGAIAVTSISMGAIALIFFGSEQLAMELLRRVDEAGGVEEGIVSRSAWEALGFGQAMMEAPMFGHGLGIGTTTVVRVLDLPIFWLGEAEVERVIFELGPIIGLGYLIARWVFGAWLVCRAMSLARHGRGEAVSAAVLTFVLLQNSWLSYSTVVGFQIWFLAGVTIALLRMGEAQSALRENNRTQAVMPSGKRTCRATVS